MTDTGFLDATRTSYNAIAAEYAARFSAELYEKPLDRAILAAFAELVPTGPVADIGCGTGHYTAQLHALGLPVSGIDLSPGMLAIARKNHPGVRFTEGSMLAIDLPDAALAGLSAMYSTIHVPDDELPAVFAEFHRVLQPGGELLLMFQVGDQPRHRSEAWGHPVDLLFHRRQPVRIIEQLHQAGLATHAHMIREPEGDEPTPHAYLLARKP